ncbi:hypothetical protein BDR04DRAFT_1151248 [Suillus decipiens]|nr:hypothetical protein BDR04DRAFT_1151248 [Suillus decipiens]
MSFLYMYGTNFFLEYPVHPSPLYLSSNITIVPPRLINLCDSLSYAQKPFRPHASLAWGRRKTPPIRLTLTKNPHYASSQSSPRGYSVPRPTYPTINIIIQYGDPSSRTSFESRVLVSATVNAGTALHTRQPSMLTPGSLFRPMKGRERGDAIRYY